MPVTSGDIPVSADYDGDEYEDVAVFRDGNWSYLSSNDSRVWNFQFGLPEINPSSVISMATVEPIMRFSALNRRLVYPKIN